MFVKDNENRDKIIYGIVRECENSNDKENWTWLDISIAVGKYAGQVVTPNACRKAYKRYLDKHIVSAKQPIENIDFAISEIDKEHNIEELKKFDGTKYHISYKDKDSYEYAKPFTQKHIDKSIKIEKRDDGSVVSDKKGIENIEEGTLLSDEDVLRLHKLDPLKWKVKSHTDNWYESNGGKDFGIIKLCQSKLIAEPKKQDLSLSLEDIKELQKEFSYKHQPIYKIVDTGNGHLALFVEIGDLHLGLFSWGEETGENADYVIIETKFREVVAKVKKFILSHPEIDTVYLVFGGDILHVDNEENTTSGGTTMQFDGRAKKMVRIAYKILSYAILELAIVKHFYVKVLEGNHSRLTEFTIFEGLKNMFSEFDNIKFDNSPMARKAVLYGTNLIGLGHGDLSNKKNQNWLQIEYAELWGKSKRREIHLFHLHKEEKEETEGGITIRRNPTIKPTDHYEYFNAFIGADKKIACYLYDELDGLDSINYFRSMFTR